MCGITMSAQHHERGRDLLQHTYLPYLMPFGIIPVLIPNVLPDPAAYADALGIEALILTGGGDVDPAHYHQPLNGSDNISPARDATELRLLARAVERGCPVLGICRGMQVINVFFGGGLVQDIPTQIGRAVNHDNAEHAVRIVDPDLARLLAAGRLTVNSFHHQGVTAATLAPPLDVFALCDDDGMIEGIRHPAHPILGVQWHPERSSPSAEADRRLIEAVLHRRLWPPHAAE
ncbi:MAG: type 1 glutamine amidotransferase [Chloroflexi bacterium]|nr:type 1 glutamine amidotransferase [Chloroflexota bacterium]